MEFLIKNTLTLSKNNKRKSVTIDRESTSIPIDAIPIGRFYIYRYRYKTPEIFSNGK